LCLNGLSHVSEETFLNLIAPCQSKTLSRFEKYQIDGALFFSTQVASPNIKTPSMTIPFLPHVSLKERENLRTRCQSYKTLSLAAQDVS
jgi:hypothetical protein